MHDQNQWDQGQALKQGHLGCQQWHSQTQRKATVILPDLKDTIIDRFSHFVFQVSVTQGAMIYDMALQSLINCHCWCAEDDVQRVFPEHFVKCSRQGMDYQRLKFRHWDCLLTESMLNHCISPPTSLSSHLRGLSLLSDYTGRSES